MSIMKKNVLFMALAIGLLMTSCASKKDLVNCQTENKSLTESLQATKEDLAAKNARIASLEEQQRGMQQLLKNAEDKYAKLQESLDKSLTNASQNNISIEKLVDQINESNQYIRHLVEVKSKSDSLNTTSLWPTICSIRVARMKSTAVQLRRCRRLPRSSRITRTTTCSLRVTPTMCPSRSPTSVTTGISQPFVPPA